MYVGDFQASGHTFLFLKPGQKEFPAVSKSAKIESSQYIIGRVQYIQIHIVISSIEVRHRQKLMKGRELQAHLGKIYFSSSCEETDHQTINIIFEKKDA